MCVSQSLLDLLRMRVKSGIYLFTKVRRKGIVRSYEPFSGSRRAPNAFPVADYRPLGFADHRTEVERSGPSHEMGTTTTSEPVDGEGGDDR